MQIIEKLQQQHEDIEREILELETIIQDSVKELNLPNFLHTLNSLYKIWDRHEKMEEKVFAIFEREKIKAPVETMLMDHIALKPHKEKIENALKSSENSALIKTLHTDLEIILAKLRAHIKLEDEIFYTIFPEEFTDEEIKQLEEIK